MTDLEQFRSAFGRVLEQVRAFKQTLTPREIALVQIGMRSSHIEEAAAQGDEARGKAHLDAMLAIMKSLPPR